MLKIGTIILLCLVSFSLQEIVVKSNFAIRLERSSSTTQEGKTVIETSDGGFVVAGRDATLQAGTVAKYDIDATLEWYKTYEGPVVKQTITSIKQTSDGYVGTGFAFLGGVSNIWIFKLDSDGAVVWSKVLETALGTEGGSEVVIDPNDNKYVVVGYIRDLSNNFQNVFVGKFNLDGTKDWWKKYGETDSDALGHSIKHIPSGGFIISGETGGAGFISKIDADGGTTGAWHKTISTDYDYFNGVDIASGGYVVLGKGIYLDKTRMIAMKFDTSGNYLWGTYFGSSSGTNNDGYKIKSTPDGGFITVSRYGSPYWMCTTKLSSSGSVEWKQIALSSDSLSNDVAVSSDGGYLVGGNNGGMSDIFVLKYFDDGQICTDESQEPAAQVWAEGDIPSLTAGSWTPGVFEDAVYTLSDYALSVENVLNPYLNELTCSIKAESETNENNGVVYVASMYLMTFLFALFLL